VTEVLQGFGVIAVVILAGYLVARAGIVPEQTQEVLGKLAFYVFSPALLFTVLSQADWAVLFSQLLPVMVGSSLVMMALGVIIWGVILRRGVTQTAIAALGVGYVNANNIGIPVSAYVLGDAALSAPIILFQVVVVAPIALSILDIQTGQRSGSLVTTLTRPLKNPIIIASAAGAFVSWQDIDIPAIVVEPFALIGQAAVPVLLVLLGWSMAGNNPLAPSAYRADLIGVTVLKLALMPAVAWVLGVWVVGLSGEALFAAVVLAALPTAQNIFSYAIRYNIHVAFARDSVMVTTVASVVAFIGITLLLV
jgi:malonate transporter and related proteins